MREIKFQYIFEDFDVLTWKKRIHKRDFYLEDIEEDNGFFSMCDIIAKRQYTWLKDKNGKEIYEGDIVEVYDDLFEVKWDENMAAFQTENIYEPLNADFFNWEINKYTKSWPEWNIKIIWNIYENPELLEKESA